MPAPPIITLLTDFGLADHYVAAMKGVILGICPEARLVDISHEIKPFAIAQAAFTLSQAYPYFPEGSIHLVVVDPGVGSARRPLLLEADGHRFVGPDNGVFTFPLERDAGYQAREIAAPRYYRQPVSSTFHGRDMFAPVAAHLAAGVASADLGARVFDPVRLQLPQGPPEISGVLRGIVLSIDRFGNLITSFRLSHVPEIGRRPFEMRIGSCTASRYCPVYSGAPGREPFVIEGSSGYLEVSINQADASKDAGARPGSPVSLRLL
jgi:S-adenosylmethionine hydrolase